MACGYCGKEGPTEVTIGCGDAKAEFCTTEHFSLFVRKIKRTVRGLPTRGRRKTKRRRNAKTPNA